MNHNLEYWLEAEMEPQITNTQSQEEVPENPELQASDNELDSENQSQNQEIQGSDDVSQDPEVPEMPEEKEDNSDFEIWKSNYFKESIKGDVNKLMELISSMRDRDELTPYQRKFVEDNWNIQLLRNNSNITDASKQIRKSIRDQLDENNPATSVVNHVFNTLETIPFLKDTFIRMMGYSGNKGELHRKFIAALTGSVQVSSSPDKENIIFNEKEYSIKIATRLNSEWGDVTIGSWSLREDDPERYLSEPELERLSEGSPEEKDVLRKRVVIESIAKHFEEQAFFINIVDENGVVYYLGWDIANALRGAYSEGKIVVKTVKSENSEAMITDDGQIVPMVDLRIYFIKESQGQDEEGNPQVEEIEFMQKRNGTLFLTAGLSTIKEASESMQGTEFKEVLYSGNPSDLKVLRRCVYSVHDLLMRQC